jgi:Methyltransferase domain
VRKLGNNCLKLIDSPQLGPQQNSRKPACACYQLKETLMAKVDWDDRYSDDEYIYGTEPNAFLVEHSSKLISPVLSLAEGEGRNAVYLASLGLQVHCVDGSALGLAKARRLAASKGVDLSTEVVDLAVYQPAANHYRSVISISAHLPSEIRCQLYPLVERCLLPDGILLLEAYAENQLSRDTGGPKDLDLLMSVSKIEREFANLEPIVLHEIERDVCEGKHHTGWASVVQFVARKPLS